MPFQVFLIAFVLQNTITNVNAEVSNLELVGTWASKTGKVLTGPGFYNPFQNQFFEPDLSGISYSFTQDGFYEEALYRAISNPTTPYCPSAILQFQHGRYSILPVPSTRDHASAAVDSNPTAGYQIHLTPFATDGRQLLSAPCTSKHSLLMHFNQTEIFKRYEVLIDPYNGRKRLNLWLEDGTPVNPMWLAFDPPQMLPTMPFDQTAVGRTGSYKKSKIRRWLAGSLEERDSRNSSVVVEFSKRWTVPERHRKMFDPEYWWPSGLLLMWIGGVLIYASRKS